MINSLIQPLRKTLLSSVAIAVMTTLVFDEVAAVQAGNTDSPRYGGILRLGTYQKPAPLDPFNTADTISTSLMELVFNRLIRLNQDGSFAPDLAERWEVSEDGLTYTFYLRHGAAFHDGAACDAADVLRTFQLISDKETSPLHYKRFEVVKKFSAPSTEVFQVELKEPFAPFLVSIWRAYIVPRNMFAKGKDDLQSFIQHPIGTGPFVFVNQTKAGTAEFKANPNYFEGRPYLDEVRITTFEQKGEVWSAFLRGELDMAFYLDRGDYADLRDNPSFQAFRVLDLFAYVLVFNMKDKLLSEPLIRKAVSCAIDREGLIQNLEKSEGLKTSGPFYPNSWAYNQKIAADAYDPERAEQVLRKAGFSKKDGVFERGGEKLSFQLLVDEKNDHLTRLGKLIRQQLQEAGIQVHIQQFTDFEKLLEEIRGNRFRFQSFLFPENLAFLDPDVAGHYWESSSIYNLGNYKSRQVDDLFRHARQMQKGFERAKAYQAIQTILAEEKPAVFLYVPFVFHVASGDLSNTGEFFTPFLRFYSLKDVYRKGGDASGH